MSEHGVGVRTSVRARSTAFLSCALLVGCAPPAAETRPSVGADPAQSYERAWPVMGTMLRVLVWDQPEREAAAAAAASRAAVVRLDSLLSNYREDSDAAAINAAAGSARAVAIDRRTADAIRQSMAFAAWSGGAFDPTVGPVVDVWGFYRESGAMPPQPALDSARALVAWQDVELEPAPPRARMRRPGMRIDFGAIGKGIALDAALAEARRAGARRAMIDLGGNIGVIGAAPGGGDWAIGLRHPREPELPFAVIDVPDGAAVATSGDYERFFVHDGVRYSHIVDPRTGWPVQGVASVSVMARESRPPGFGESIGGGTLSDGLSTSLFVMSIEEGCAFIRDLPGVAVIWVRPPEPDGSRLRATVGGVEADRIGVAADVAVEHCEDSGR